MLYEQVLSGLEKISIEKRKNMSPQEVKERELIERVQKYNDPIAMSQLLIEYRPILIKLVKDSKLDRAVGFETAKQIANTEFKRAVKEKFNLNQNTSAPHTYFYGALFGTLQNAEKDNRNTVARTSQNLEGYKRVVDISKNFLAREGNKNPTSKEILDFAKKNDLTKGKSFNVSIIDRIRDRSFTEWSGGKKFGGDSAGDAESLTYDEQFGHGKFKPSEIMQQQFEEQTIKNEIKNFTQKPNEQRFFREIYELDEFKGKKSNPHRASINNGVTDHQGKKLLAGFEKYLKDKGVF